MKMSLKKNIDVSQYKLIKHRVAFLLNSGASPFYPSYRLFESAEAAFFKLKTTLPMNLLRTVQIFLAYVGKSFSHWLNQIANLQNPSCL